MGDENLIEEYLEEVRAMLPADDLPADDLLDETRDHLLCVVEREIAEGTSRPAAERTAISHFGGARGVVDSWLRARRMTAARRAAFWGSVLAVTGFTAHLELEHFAYSLGMRLPFPERGVGSASAWLCGGALCLSAALWAERSQRLPTEAVALAGLCSCVDAAACGAFATNRLLDVASIVGRLHGGAAAVLVILVAVQWLAAFAFLGAAAYGLRWCWVTRRVA